MNNALIVSLTYPEYNYIRIIQTHTCMTFFCGNVGKRPWSFFHR